MKTDTIRRKFRKHNVRFVALPDESPRSYAPSDVQHRKDALYPVALSTRHKYFDPRVRYQQVEVPSKISSRLTAYAMYLLEKKS
jgi:hypothetical protein